MQTVLLFNPGFLLRLVAFRGSGKTSNWLRTSGDLEAVDELTSDLVQFPDAEVNSG